MDSTAIPMKATRLWLRVLVFWLVFVAALFLPAGSLEWPEAWLFLALYFAFAVPTVGWLARHRPQLLVERMKGPIQGDQKRWDKLFVLASMPIGIAFIVVLGFDAVRFGWSDPSLPVVVIGFALLAPALALLFRVLRENPYLSKAVRIQRGHSVITTGPYRMVRHPMYVAVIAFSLALPLALGALYALIPAGALAILTVVRTALEDRTLMRELPGYAEYAARVRYRLVPGVW